MNQPIQWGDLATLLTVAVLVVGGIWRAASLIAALRHELTEYKVEVAEKYVSIQSIHEIEERLINSIERLSDRLDRLLENM